MPRQILITGNRSGATVTSKSLLLMLALAALVVASLIVYGDFGETFRQLSGFPLKHLLASLALALLNYFFRFARWGYYLKVLGIKIPLSSSSLVFLSGLAMSITPGKMGEVLKSHLLRDRTGVPVSISLPVVVMERITDLVAVVATGLVGLALLPVPVLITLSAVLAVCSVALLIMAPNYSQRLVDIPLLRRWKIELLNSQQSLRLLVSPRVMLAAVILGTVAWCSEGVALWVILRGLGESLDMQKVLPIYAAATLVGAITTLPGGLGGTEAGMVSLLQQNGLPRDAASAGTLLVRVVTLFFAAILGLVALVFVKRMKVAGRTETSTLSVNG